MHPASLDEATLLRECRIRRQRRSGPGGQHRNKVETAVVIKHVPTDTQGEASERRSQEENRKQAIFRLRLNLALNIRQQLDLSQFTPTPLWTSRCRNGKLSISSEHADFPAILAEALDVLTAYEMDAKAAADRLGCTASQLIKLLQDEPRAISLVNVQRQIRDKPPYR